MPLRQAIWQALCLNATKFVAISDTVLWGRRGPQRLRGILPDHHLQTSDFEVRIVSRAPRKIVGSQIRFSARIDGIWCGGERAMGQPAFFDLDRRLEAINAKGDA
jgi:hypothetical protein